MKSECVYFSKGNFVYNILKHEPESKLEAFKRTTENREDQSNHEKISDQSQLTT